MAELLVRADKRGKEQHHVKKAKFVFIAVVIMMLSLVAVAAVSADCGCDDPCPPPTPPPCPPPDGAICSPGFWKNHTELWFEDPQWTDPGWMLDVLRARGNQRDLFQYRFEVSDWLNAAYPDAPCDD